MATVPPFIISERLRERLRKGESRATLGAQLHANPNNLNTVLVPDGTTSYKRYPDEVVRDGAAAYFRFDTVVTGKYADTIRTNYTETIGDVTPNQTPLLTQGPGDDNGKSVQVNAADGIVGHLEHDAFPAAHEFLFETTGTGPGEFFKITGSAGDVVFTLNADGTITADTRNSSHTVLRHKDSLAAINDGTSRHIVYRDTGSACALFINGVSQ